MDAEIHTRLKSTSHIVIKQPKYARITLTKEKSKPIERKQKETCAHTSFEGNPDGTLLGAFLKHASEFVKKWIRL